MHPTARTSPRTLPPQEVDRGNRIRRPLTGPCSSVTLSRDPASERGQRISLPVSVINETQCNARRAECGCALRTLPQQPGSRPGADVTRRDRSDTR
jgi:hypothetical protein